MTATTPSGVRPELEEKLRSIQSITDRALSTLDPQGLLEALVVRVREALQADTAAILLLDRPSDHLVATAASGLEEEVEQGVRIRIGRGFAGRIAAEGHAVVLDEVDHTNVVNPILLAKGIRSMMGAPLLADGSAIGVLHVGTLTPRAFTAEEVDLLQLAADRAAIAVQALEASLDRSAASALQRSLLPAALPAISGLGVAARYVPGTGNIGGDWYDVFVLPSGEICAVIGDVAGSGLRAAAIMGRVRSALRAYALETTDPADMLSRLDNKLRFFEPDVMVTVLCAVFSPSVGRMRISSAGHPPPILVVPGQPAAPVPLIPDVLIGVLDTRARHVTILDVPPGAVLGMYTDGLVERRDKPIDQNIARLCAAMTTADPETVCACVMAAMANSSPYRDDVALLVFRRENADAGESRPVRLRSDALTTTDFDVQWTGRHVVVTMPAEIDITNSAGVDTVLTGLVAKEPQIITADMTPTVFCDSSGIHALARAHRLAVSNGAELRFAIGNSPVMRVFQLTGLDQIVPIYRDVSESLAAPLAARQA